MAVGHDDGGIEVERSERRRFLRIEPHRMAHRQARFLGAALHIEVAGVSFYHQGSADLVDDAIRARNVDYFLCGIAGRRFTKNYLPRILGKLNPRVIVPTHYDNFFQPLEEPLDFSMNVNLTSFADEVRAVSADFNVQALPLTETVGTR